MIPWISSDGQFFRSQVFLRSPPAHPVWAFQRSLAHKGILPASATHSEGGRIELGDFGVTGGHASVTGHKGVETCTESGNSIQYIVTYKK